MGMPRANSSFEEAERHHRMIVSVKADTGRNDEWQQGGKVTSQSRDIWLLQLWRLRRAGLELR
jgi:hypothetical protein